MRLRHCSLRIIALLAAVVTVSCSSTGRARKVESPPPLHAAALANDVDAARAAMARGIAVDTTYQGKTPLHLAARGGKLTVADFLVTKGADVNARDGEGATPLHLAVFSTRASEMISFLLKQGANSAARNESGETPSDVARGAAQYNAKQAKACDEKVRANKTLVRPKVVAQQGGVGIVQSSYYTTRTGRMVNGRMVYDNPVDWSAKASAYRKRAAAFAKLARILSGGRSTP